VYRQIQYEEIKKKKKLFEMRREIILIVIYLSPFIVYLFPVIRLCSLSYFFIESYIRKVPVICTTTFSARLTNRIVRLSLSHAGNCFAS